MAVPAKNLYQRRNLPERSRVPEEAMITEVEKGRDESLDDAMRALEAYRSLCMVEGRWVESNTVQRCQAIVRALKGCRLKPRKPGALDEPAIGFVATVRM